MVQSEPRGVKDRSYWKRKNITDFIEFVSKSMPEETELASFLKRQLDHFMANESPACAAQTDLFEDQDGIPTSSQEIVASLFRYPGVPTTEKAMNEQGGNVWHK